MGGDVVIKHFINKDSMNIFIKDYSIKDISFSGKMPDGKYCLSYINPPKNNNKTWNFIKK